VDVGGKAAKPPFASLCYSASTVGTRRRLRLTAQGSGNYGFQMMQLYLKKKRSTT